MNPGLNLLSTYYHSKNIVYALRCEHDKFYIGKSYNLITRLNNHIINKDTRWTTIHQPYALDNLIEIKNGIPGMLAMENALTLEYMTKYGVDNVRGDIYCNVNLDYHLHRIANMHIRSIKNECYQCGSREHYVNSCLQRKQNSKCFNCHQFGHWEKECPLKRNNALNDHKKRKHELLIIESTNQDETTESSKKRKLD